jgi:hypothetical protein
MKIFLLILLVLLCFGCKQTRRQTASISEKLSEMTEQADIIVVVRSRPGNFKTMRDIDIMTRNIYVILSILLFVSCGNNPRRENVIADLPVEETVIVQEKLDSNLVEGVLRLIQHGQHLKYPEIPMEESFIIMGFLVEERSRGGIVSLDSIVTISPFHNFFRIHNESIRYKGMLNIKGYNVAIFDPGNFGCSFYNIDSLRQIPLGDFKRFPIKNVIIERFRIYNGKLKYLENELVVGDPAALK